MTARLPNHLSLRLPLVRRVLALVGSLTVSGIAVALARFGGGRLLVVGPNYRQAKVVVEHDFGKA